MFQDPFSTLFPIAYMDARRATKTMLNHHFDLFFLFSRSLSHERDQKLKACDSFCRDEKRESFLLSVQHETRIEEIEVAVASRTRNSHSPAIHEMLSYIMDKCFA